MRNPIDAQLYHEQLRKEIDIARMEEEMARGRREGLSIALKHLEAEQERADRPKGKAPARHIRKDEDRVEECTEEREG